MAQAIQAAEMPDASASSRIAPIAENYADLLQVLIGQVWKDGEVNAVFGKALRVLGHAAPFEPVRNLLHRAAD